MQNIINKARELFMRYGIRNITMDKLSGELGISKKTLYQKIPNKSQLIQRIIKTFVEEQKVEISGIKENADHAIEEMHLIAEKAIEQIRRVPPSVPFELKKYFPESWSIMEDYHSGFVLETIKDNLIRGIQEGLYRDDLNIDIIPVLYASKIPVIVDGEFFQDTKLSQEDIFKEFVLYHLHGVVSKEGNELINKYFNY